MNIFLTSSISATPAEPVGAKAPSLLSNDHKRSWIDREANQSFALFCLAQGYPSPAFR